jgi:hypothetical protein
MYRTLTIGAVSALTLTSAAADETLKFRSVLHATFVQSQDVGDVDGHTMSLTRYSGLTSFPDGTTGTGYFVAVTDYIKGAGTFSVYNNLALNDGFGSLVQGERHDDNGWNNKPISGNSDCSRRQGKV